MIFNGEGCATIALLYTYTEGKKLYEEGKEMEKERKSVASCKDSV